MWFHRHVLIGLKWVLLRVCEATAHESVRMTANEEGSYQRQLEGSVLPETHLGWSEVGSPGPQILQKHNT